MARSKTEKSVKVKSPADLEITDDLREWAARKHGAMYLPDVFLQEFRDKAAARGATYADCAQALRNYINWESPTGKFYKADYWEQQVRRARKMERNPPRSSLPPLFCAGQPVNAQGARLAEPAPAAKPLAEVMLNAVEREATTAARRADLAALRAGLRGGA